MHPESGLSVHDVTHFYGDFCAVRGADLRVAPGQVHCLLGPSGSGKSTLLRLVAGLETLQQGHIHIDGHPVASPKRSVPPEARSVGFVFQDYALFPHLDVLRNVLFGMPKGNERQQQARQLLEQVGMDDFADAMPHTLSGGQQQRVALARALARQPKLMLLDEPFSGLDRRLRQSIRDTTLEVLRSAGVATLMVTHDPGEALLTGDVISVIHRGCIEQSGTPDDVYRRSQNRHVAETFGPVNVLAAIVQATPGTAGRVITPWGPWDVAMPDGTEVEILIRPESLALVAVGSETTTPCARGRLVDASQDGGLAHLTVELEDGTALRVHDLARHGWQVGQDVGVCVDPDAARILAVDVSRRNPSRRNATG